LGEICQFPYINNKAIDREKMSASGIENNLVKMNLYGPLGDVDDGYTFECKN